MSTTDTCADCGRPRDNHNVRHPFVSRAGGASEAAIEALPAVVLVELPFAGRQPGSVYVNPADVSGVAHHEVATRHPESVLTLRSGEKHHIGLSHHEVARRLQAR